MFPFTQRFRYENTLHEFICFLVKSCSIPLRVNISPAKSQCIRTFPGEFTLTHDVDQPKLYPDLTEALGQSCLATACSTSHAAVLDVERRPKNLGIDRSPEVPFLGADVFMNYGVGSDHLIPKMVLHQFNSPSSGGQHSSWWSHSSQMCFCAVSKHNFVHRFLMVTWWSIILSHTEYDMIWYYIIVQYITLYKNYVELYYYIRLQYVMFIALYYITLGYIISH